MFTENNPHQLEYCVADWDKVNMHLKSTLTNVCTRMSHAPLFINNGNVNGEVTLTTSELLPPKVARRIHGGEQPLEAVHAQFPLGTACSSLLELPHYVLQA